MMNWRAALDSRLSCSGWLALAERTGIADQTLTSGRRCKLHFDPSPLHSSLIHVFDLLFLVTTPIRTDWTGLG